MDAWKYQIELAAHCEALAQAEEREEALRDPWDIAGRWHRGQALWHLEFAAALAHAA